MTDDSDAIGGHNPEFLSTSTFCITLHAATMSATLAPSVLSPDNPVTETSVDETLAKLGLKLPPDQAAEYTSFLKGIWEVWHKVDGMEDYVPSVDAERFPRLNVHRPTEEDNAANAWAWKVTIKDKENRAGLLAGKTVCVKVRCLLDTLMTGQCSC